MKVLPSFILSVLFAAFVKAQDDEVTCSYRQDIKVTDKVHISQETSPENNTITVEVIYDGIGWIGFGFSRDGMMVGNSVVIGQPGGIVTDLPNPGKFSLDGYAIPSVVPLPKSQQTLIDAYIGDNDTHTTLRFTKLLEEDGELGISATEENIAIYGVGRDIELLSLHDYHGAFPIILSACSNVTRDDGVAARAILFNDRPVKRDIWAIHGYMMAAAWGVLVPLGVGSCMLRSFIPGKHTWLAFHWFCNGLATLLTIGAFGLAVYTTSNENSPHFKYPHQIAGLIVFIFVFLQALGGILRPHSENKRDATMDADEPMTKEQKQRRGWEVAHRVFGVGLLCLAWWNCQRGIHTFADRFGSEDEEMHTIVFWSVAGGLMLIIVTMCIIGRFF